MQKYFGSPSKITNWDINCSVDKGGIIDTYPTYIFKTSRNKCGGGFKQRSQITTSKAISTSIKSIYNFQSIFSFYDKADYKQKFDIFSINDGRKNCAPPLVLSIESDGVLNLRGDYKTGPGEQCERDVLNTKNYSTNSIKRDGTKYKLNLITKFTTTIFYITRFSYLSIKPFISIITIVSWYIYFIIRYKIATIFH